MQAKSGGKTRGIDQKDKSALSDVGQPNALGKSCGQGLTQLPVKRIQSLGALGQRPESVVANPVKGGT